jgi:hypothetical protein
VLATVAVSLFSLPLALLAAGVPAALLALAALVSGGGLMLSNTVWESTLQRHVPAEALSRVSAYDWFGSMAFAPLGLALWGPVSALVGVELSLWLAFALQVASTLALLAVPDIRRLENAPLCA